MFEQQLYSFEGPAVPSKEGDLFHSYEVGRWKISTRIYQILAISLVLNLAILGFVGQAELLTTRGCDSPFVGRVCQVLDMAYVGTVLFGTDREYVDAEYERADLGDAEITYIDVSGVQPPFEYPEGFFYKEPTAETMTDSGFIAPGIPATPSTSGSSIFDTQARAPKFNPNPVEGTVPDSPFKIDSDQTVGKNVSRPKGGRIRTGTSENSENSSTSTNTEKKLEITPEQVASLEALNKRPFKDLAASVNQLLANKEVDLQSQFLVSAKAKLSKDGRLEKKNFKFIRAESTDQKMIDVVKRSIEAFSESGFLQILSELEGKDLNLELKQDQTNISAFVQSELERETRASSLKGILKLGIDLAISKKEEAIAELEKLNDPAKATELQNDRDDLELLKKTVVSTDGKKLLINFSVDKSIVQAMIQRKLKDEAEKAAELKKPNGNSQVPANNNTAIK